ncbi:hypothetical protein [Streptomyces anandii]|uniref:hypothetical protein n=1 Tax=Streptomyces anandii TaxID=285454 RepID=UPI001E64EEAA|nr:hypothetical protein [Streptomyces anandii]
MTAMASVCGVTVSALVIVIVVAVLRLREVAVTVLAMLPVVPVAPAVGAIRLPVTGVPPVTLMPRLAGTTAVAALAVPLPRTLSVPPTARFGRRCEPLLLSR